MNSKRIQASSWTISGKHKEYEREKFKRYRNSEKESDWNSEMNNSISQIKNSVESLSKRVDHIKGKISGLWRHSRYIRTIR
jgi:hypothetical protein